MGLRQLSVTPQVIPEIKQVIRSLAIPQAQDIAKHAEGFDVARDVEAYLRGELKKLCPAIGTSRNFNAAKWLTANITPVTAAAMPRETLEAFYFTIAAMTNDKDK